MAKLSVSTISNAFSTGGGGVHFEEQIQAPVNTKTKKQPDGCLYSGTPSADDSRPHPLRFRQGACGCGESVA